MLRLSILVGLKILHLFSFLNKQDLFEKKIEKVSLKECWKEYDGPQEYDTCLEFIKQQFLAQNEDPEKRAVYSHVTTATDKENVKMVFDDVQHIVVDRSLQQAGLL